MFHRIVVPLDTSVFAEAALAPAIAIAKASRAEVDLVIVHQLSLLVPEGLDMVEASSREEERAYTCSVLTPLIARLAQEGVTAQVVQLDRPPAGALLAHIEGRQADLVVMVTHGRTGLERALLGSVADRLMRHSSTPVLMIRPAVAAHLSPASALGESGFHRIVVPLDGSVAAEAVLGEAEALARRSSATILLLRVVTPVPGFDFDVLVPTGMVGTVVDEEATQEMIAEAEEYLVRVAADLARNGQLTVEVVVHVAGNVGSVLPGLCRNHGADLVAMTTHGRGASRLFLGSVADAILRETACALLLHRQPAALAPQRDHTVEGMMLVGSPG